MIPSIRPYPMPTELPRNTATWQPDPNRAAVLVHDMQRYFVDFFPPDCPPVTPLISHVSRICAAARRQGMPVLYTAQPGGMSTAERGLLRDIWGPGMAADPRAREIVPALAPRPGDVILPKYRYSAFHRSDLADRLTALGRDQLVLCGVYAHIGCLMTACDAFSRDIQVFLIADAVADFSAQDHRMALEYAARYCAMTMTTEAVLRHLTEAPVPGG